MQQFLVHNITENITLLFLRSFILTLLFFRNRIMPNQNLCGPMMGEWNVTPVSCRGLDSKVSCKYTYSTWCPTCERDPPRRRSKSESFDAPCRRKGREMKTLAPKKPDYNLENLEYDVHKEYL